MVKLQKQISRRIGNKEYAKYVIVIPKKDIDRVGFKEGDSLNLKIANDKIILLKS